MFAFGHEFEQVRNTFIMKLSEKYEVHTCKEKGSGIGFINTAKPSHRKIKKCF